VGQSKNWLARVAQVDYHVHYVPPRYDFNGLFFDDLITSVSRLSVLRERVARVLRLNQWVVIICVTMIANDEFGYDSEHYFHGCSCLMPPINFELLSSTYVLQLVQHSNRLYSYPAGSSSFGNEGPSTFEAQACFQFLGVNLSTIPLNASYRMVSLFSPSKVASPTYQSAERCVAFQVLPLCLAPRYLHNLVVVPNPYVVVPEIIALLRRQIRQWFPSDGLWLGHWLIGSFTTAKERLPPALRLLV
jgi:hypothetical protein